MSADISLKKKSNDILFWCLNFYFYRLTVACIFKVTFSVYEIVMIQENYSTIDVGSIEFNTTIPNPPYIFNMVIGVRCEARQRIFLYDLNLPQTPSSK